MYYKIIHSNGVIEKYKDPIFVMWQPQNNAWILSNKENANGILTSNGSRVYAFNTTPNLPDNIEKIQIKELEMDGYDPDENYNL